MISLIKKVFTLFLLICITVNSSGCANTAADKTGAVSESTESDEYVVPLVEAEEQVVPSGVIAQNDALTLEWDSEGNALFLKDKNGGTWGSLPEKQYLTSDLGGGAKRYVESHLKIEYIEPQNMMVKTANSYSGAYEDGRVYSVPIQNGIRITYYFDDIGIVIPVEYTLTNSAIKASIDVKGIHEDIYKLLKISLLPFCAAAENNKQDYLFLPDGSGILMYCDPDKGARSYWSPVYGQDPTVVADIKTKNSAVTRLPVFGIKKGNSALCGIITEGEGAAEINASTGDPDITYSNVYASFNVRGSDTTKIPDLFGRKQVINKYSEKMIDTKALMVEYYPLTPEKQAYSEMADCYRNYLIREKGLLKHENDQPLYFDFPMAADIRKFYFGFPVNVTTAVSDFNDVKDILTQTVEEFKVKPVVRLSGIGQDGVEIGKLGGGFKFENVLGSQRSFDLLSSLAKEKGIDLYPDFDIVRFRNNSLSFNFLSAAKAPTTLVAYQYFYDIATKGQNMDKYRYMLISPTKLNQAAKQAASFLLKKKINNISLSTLGMTAYSDYQSPKYYLRNGLTSVVSDIQKGLGEYNMKLMVEEANAYAAVSAGHILSSPTQTSRFLSEDETIPFYQMVFKGYVPMSTMSVNLQNDADKEILYAASVGIGLLYTVCQNDTLQFVSSPFTALSAGRYSLIKQDIGQQVNRLKNAFEGTKNAGIKDYIRLEAGVYKTVFDNGASVIVNYNEKPYHNGNIRIEPIDFLFGRGGEGK